MKWFAAIWMAVLLSVLPPQCKAEAPDIGSVKSCTEIARSILSSEAKREMKIAPFSPENLNCAGAHGIAADATIQLTKTSWNKALQRWEFTLRCTRPHDCVPFLVWTGEGNHSAPRMESPPSVTPTKLSPSPGKQLLTNQDAKGAGVISVALVKPGQKVTLTWDQRGIRVVLPVTCLDAGGMGQFVRVRLPNAPRILRAEVVGNAMLRASL